MRRWLRIATTVLALAATGTLVPTAGEAGAAETPVRVSVWNKPKVVFTALTSAEGDTRAHTWVQWSASRPATMTTTIRDGAGAAITSHTEHMEVPRDRLTTFDYVDAAGRDLPSGEYTLQIDAVDADGNRDSELFPIPLDRDTVVPLEGVTKGRTYPGNVTVAVGPRPGITLTKAKFAVEDASDWTCAYTGDLKPGLAGRVQATFTVADCGNADARGRAVFEFTDRLGATQRGFTPEVAFRTADRLAPTAKLDAGTAAATTLHLLRPGTYETTPTTYAVRDASQITSATYEIRNGFGIVVASGDLTRSGGPASDILTRLYELRWNGTRTNGTLLPAARYRVTTRFVDAFGYRTTGPAVTIDLDSTIPGTLAVTRVDGYRWQVVVTPKSDAGVTAVAVSTVHPSQYDPAPTAVPYDPATGTYRTVLSLAGRSAGTYPVRALITRGTAAAATTFTTPDQELVLAADTAAPAVTPPANTRLYLTLPGQYAAGTFTFGVSDQSAVRSADFVVSGTDGTPVDHTLAAGGEGRTSFTWDGTGPDGVRLPGGDYVVRTTFTDAAGNATPAAVTVHLDDTVPGTLTAAPAGDNAFTVELTPTPGVTVQAAGVALIGNSCCGAAMERDPATGRYRVTVDLDGRPAGTYHLTSLVARDTPGAAAPYGYYWTAPVTVTVTH